MLCLDGSVGIRILGAGYHQHTQFGSILTHRDELNAALSKTLLMIVRTVERLQLWLLLLNQHISTLINNGPNSTPKYHLF